MVAERNKHRVKQRQGELLQVVVSPALKQAIRELAAAEAMPMTLWIERQLRATVEATGRALE